MNKLVKFIRIPFADKLLLTEALAFLCLAKLVILLLPLRKVAPFIGRLEDKARESLTAQEQESAKRIRDSIARGGKAVPWKSVCLDQALAGQVMLNRRKIPSSLCLGAIRDPEENSKMKGHAWILCGGNILIGGSRSKRFIEVARFTKSFGLLS